MIAEAEFLFCCLCRTLKQKNYFSVHFFGFSIPVSRAQETFVPKPSFFVSVSAISILPSNTVLGTQMFSITKMLWPKSELSLTQIHTGCVNAVQLLQKELDCIITILSMSFLDQNCLGQCYKKHLAANYLPFKSLLFLIFFFCKIEVEPLYCTAVPFWPSNTKKHCIVITGLDVPLGLPVHQHVDISSVTWIFRVTFI